MLQLLAALGAEYVMLEYLATAVVAVVCACGFVCGFVLFHDVSMRLWVLLFDFFKIHVFAFVAAEDLAVGGAIVRLRCVLLGV